MANKKEEKDFLDEKPKKTGDKSTLSKVVNIILWIIVLGWMAICVTDYVLTINEKDPMFCLNKQTKEYEDGTVKVCTGLGYKYYEYNRTKVNVKSQFGFFWIKEQTPTQE